MESGERIKYTYEHSLNGKSRTVIVKYGTFIRRARRKKKFLADWDADPMAVVMIDGNKRASRVRMSNLEKI